MEGGAGKGESNTNSPLKKQEETEKASGHTGVRKVG